jgi:hypothetical protein
VRLRDLPGGEHLVTVAMQSCAREYERRLDVYMRERFGDRAPRIFQRWRDGLAFRYLRHRLPPELNSITLTAIAEERARDAVASLVALETGRAGFRAWRFSEGRRLRAPPDEL